ncbi:MAG: nucleoside triphosphate pyrophosphohydrolase [Planctomycetota bacterium]
MRGPAQRGAPRGLALAGRFGPTYPAAVVPPLEDPRLPAFAHLLGVIARLRAPDGCPWDREQTPQTMAPHLLEEAFEAADAIRQDDPGAACEELGDVLMNVLMIAQMEGEAARFDAGDVARRIADKLVRRHPHVFGDARADDAQQVLRRWEEIKRSEKPGTRRGALDGVPLALPALLRAFRVGEKAARVGFDWPDREGPRRKVDEELGELDAAAARGERAAIEHELGDVLFSVCNLARHLGVEPETALRGTIDRFSARFRRVEDEFGDRLGQATLGELDAAWDRAKRALEPGRPRQD